MITAIDAQLNAIEQGFREAGPTTPAPYASWRALDAAELIAVYKREFGDNWQSAFEHTVNITVA